MEMTYGGAMVMPAEYTIIDEEEMTYLDGGKNGKWNARSTVGAAIDVAIVLAGLGATIRSISALKTLLKNNKIITRKVKHEIIKLFGSVAGSCVTAAIDILMICCGTSIGGIFAYALDYIDGKVGCGGLNGYVFG